MDKLMPFLPSIISVVGMYLMYRKFDPNNDQNPVQKEISNVFKTLNPVSKDALTKALMEAVGKFGGGTVKDQKNDHKEL
jgi:Ca2+-binding EF-hand superfamily protein